MNFPKKKLRKIFESRLFQAILVGLLGALGIGVSQIELEEKSPGAYLHYAIDPEVDS